MANQNYTDLPAAAALTLLDGFVGRRNGATQDTSNQLSLLAKLFRETGLYGAIGQGYTVARGVNGKAEKGKAISAGTSTVSNTSVTAGSIVLITLVGTQTNQGNLRVDITPGTGFVVTSSQVGHAGNYDYVIVETI